MHFYEEGCFLQVIKNTQQLKEEIIMHARSMIGTPFRHAGRDQFGIDCVGVLLVSLHKTGLTKWDDVSYSRSIDPVRLRNEILIFCNEAEKDHEIDIADVLIFNVLGVPQHAALVTDMGDHLGIIHSNESLGFVTEHRLDEKWLNRLHSVYVWKGIESWQV